MHSPKVLSILIPFFAASVASATFEDLPKKPLKYEIAGHTRPCCSFVPSLMAKLMGIAGFADPTRLGKHHFGPGSRKHLSEQVGMTYACRAGFVDLSHVRDNADWAAHILQILTTEIGSGKTYRVRAEGGVASATLVLPSQHGAELRELTPEQLGEIAEALTYDFALFHEIATSFPMAVSGPRIPLLTEKLVNERSSSFSVEDSYSNFLGAVLGTRAALDPDRSYNVAMTDFLGRALKEGEVLSLSDAKKVFHSLKGNWWKGGVFKGFKQVKKRTFAYRDTIEPLLATTRTARKLCGDQPSPMNLEISDILSATGFPAGEVAYLKIKPEAHYARKLRRLGVKFEKDGTITRDVFPHLIGRIQKNFSLRLN